MTTVHHVVGTRPNFIKLAPVFAALKKRSEFKQAVVHTGQHFGASMSDNFFRDLRLPEPQIELEVPQGSQTRQTAQIMLGLERAWADERPDIAIVYGDVTSSL